MENLPYEILGEISSWVKVPLYLSRVNKLFHSLVVHKQVTSLEELKTFVDEDYAIGVVLSTDTVEKYAEDLLQYSCEVKNKSAALYFRDFVSWGSTSIPYLYMFDDVSIPELFNEITASRYGAINIVKSITTNISCFIRTYCKLRDLEELRRYIDYKDKLLEQACMHNIPEILDWYEVRDEETLLIYTIEKDSIDVLKKLEIVDIDDALDGAIYWNAPRCVKYLLEKGAIPPENLSLEGCGVEIVRLLHYMLTDEIIIDLFKNSSKEVVKYLLDTVEYDEVEISDIILSRGYYDLAYEINPCDRIKLLYACSIENLDTVKELYNGEDIFGQFARSSYGLLKILYKGVVPLYPIITYDKARFYYDMGAMSPEVMLECYIRQEGNSIKVVKYLESKGAVSRIESAVPRVNRYLGFK